MGITTIQVREHLGNDYGERADGSSPDLQPHIDRANALVSRLLTMATAANGRLVPTTTEQNMIALSLACHFYCKYDRLNTSATTEGASASFVQGGSTINAVGEYWKQEAIESDPSGLVNVLLNRLMASTASVGRRPADQSSYDDRSAD